MSIPEKIPDLNADLYAQNHSLQYGLAHEILTKLSVKPTDVIVDVGCGLGDNTAELAKRATLGEVEGVDPSASMIESASEHFEKNLPNLHFQLASIENAVFSRKSNIVTAFSSFHWLKDARGVMKKLTEEVLTEDGRMLILTYPKESPYYGYMEKALKNDKYRDYQSLSSNQTMLSTQDYRDFFAENNLKVLQFEERPMLAKYSNDEEVFGFIKGWLSNYVPLPEHLQDQYIREVIEIVRKEQGSTSQIPYTALIMEVQK